MTMHTNRSYQIVGFIFIQLVIFAGYSCQKTLKREAYVQEEFISQHQLCECYVINFSTGGILKLMECFNSYDIDNDSIDPYSIQISKGKIALINNNIERQFDADSCLNSWIAQTHMFTSEIDGIVTPLNINTLKGSLIDALGKSKIPFPDGNIGGKQGQFPVTSLVIYKKQDKVEEWKVNRISHDQDELRELISHLQQDSVFMDALGGGKDGLYRIPITYFRRNQLNAFEKNGYGIEVIQLIGID